MLTRTRASMFATLLTFSLIVTGCGFHLRGKVVVPDELMSMSIRGGELEFVQRLKKGLAFSDIAVVEEMDGISMLDLSQMTYEKTANATDDQGITTSYRLEYTVPYEVSGPKGVSWHKANVNDSRTFSFNATDALLSEREEDFLKEDMHREMVNRLLRQLSRVSPPVAKAES